MSEPDTAQHMLDCFGGPLEPPYAMSGLDIEQHSIRYVRTGHQAASATSVPDIEPHTRCPYRTSSLTARTKPPYALLAPGAA
eukprot:2028010-Rhodomonas_salina.2